MALKSATTTLATIQMRRGMEENFDPDQMTAGEWAVSTDSKKVWMCFMPGLVLRMATYEAFEKDMEEIRAILVEAQDIQAAIELWMKLAESYTHGGTGKREGEDTDNAKYYMNQAKAYADNAEAVTGVSVMTVKKAGIGKPDGITISADTDGTMHALSGASKAIYGDTAVSLGRKDGSNVGKQSIAYGNSVVASGVNTIASGQYCESLGAGSATFGTSNISYGNNAVCTGGYLEAVDSYSQAEGCGSISAGYGSHAEGAQNIAGVKHIFLISSVDPSTKKITFDNTYKGFSDAFAALSIGSAIRVANMSYINDAITFTVESLGTDGKSVFVNESIPTSNFTVKFAALVQSGINLAGCHAEGRRSISNGQYSHAEGFETEARGYCSHSEGYSTEATGEHSHAEGYSTEATGEHSHAEGHGTEAMGDQSHAEGHGTEAMGDQSHAEGIYTTAFSAYSHASGGGCVSVGIASHSEGLQTISGNGYILHVKNVNTDEHRIAFTEIYENFQEAFSKISIGIKMHVMNIAHINTASVFTVNSIDLKTNSVIVNEDIPTSDFTPWLAVLSVANTANVTTHSEGRRTIASGRSSHAEGEETKGKGMCSHAEGYYSTALDHQHAQGHCNNTSLATGGSATGTGSGTAFVIGNGTTTAASNAARIDYNGKLWCKQAYSSTGADYAEYFEWQDGNANEEDRRGYFVTMDGEKIRKANEGDYILGIISGNPCVIGNTDMEWQGQFMRDEFGSFIKEKHMETIKEPSIDEEGNTIEIEKEVEVEFYKVNPNYDPESSYTFRDSRKEWDTVGMMGVLPVRDDGTCQVNGFCKCTGGGIATSSESGYRVIKRVSENIVKVVLK